MSAASAVTAQDPHLGRTLKSSYRIDKILGAGGMGVVYQGEHLALHKSVAIKTLKPESYKTKSNRERFEREAAIAAKLTHPGVTQVFDFGIDEDLPYLVMEFVDGASLSDVLEKEGPLPPARALSIARQIVSVLAEAHRLNLVHRDIKPDNIRLLRYAPDTPPVVKVLDFGIAKEIGGTEQEAKLTATGAILGTPMYLSPEQAAGTAVDGRSDQYSTGGVLYEMLSGRPPVFGTSLASILVNQISKPPPPLPATVPDVLARVIMRMLRKSPAERFQDDAALDKALADCESAAAKAKTASRPTPESLIDTSPVIPTEKRSLMPLLIAALLGVCFTVSVAVVVGKRGRGGANQIQPTTAKLVEPAEKTTTPTAVIGNPTGPSPAGGPTVAQEDPAGSAAAKKPRKSGRKKDNPYAVKVIR